MRQSQTSFFHAQTRVVSITTDAAKSKLQTSGKDNNKTKLSPNAVDSSVLPQVHVMDFRKINTEKTVLTAARRRNLIRQLREKMALSRQHSAVFSAHPCVSHMDNTRKKTVAMSCPDFDRVANGYSSNSNSA